MSWQSYVDDHLLGPGKIAKAAILGKQGGVWATSGGFAPNEAEILKAMKGPVAEIQASGLRIVKDEKYLYIHGGEGDRSIYFRKGGNGAIVAKTNLAIIVALYEEPIQAAEATPVVEKLVDYLISVNY